MPRVIDLFCGCGGLSLGFEKAGFQLEGTLRKNAVKNGEVLDMKLYALVREEDAHAL